jgi:hypothetical protein
VPRSRSFGMWTLLVLGAFCLGTILFMVIPKRQGLFFWDKTPEQLCRVFPSGRNECSAVVHQEETLKDVTEKEQVPDEVVERRT